VKRFRVLTLAALAQGLGDAAVGFRYETVARPKGLQWAEWLDRTTKRFAAASDELEANWIACLGEVNVGSITTAVVLSYMSYRLPDIDWRSGHPKLAAFHADFVKRPSMVATEIGK
jgi:glutathione S-transferase